MISSEVQRTLVKSPPELWAEISDPESLARHLGEFGEIRITRVQPEQKVEWEADDASGSVVIKPSGWGTKVKLTVTRELAEVDAEAEVAAAPPAEPADDEPEQGLERMPESAHEPESKHEPESEHEPESAHEPEHAYEADQAHEPTLGDEVADEPYATTVLDGEDAEAEPIAEVALALEPEPPAERAARSEPEPRRGFFARLFGRRRARTDEPSRRLARGARVRPARERVDRRRARHAGARL